MRTIVFGVIGALVLLGTIAAYGFVSGFSSFSRATSDWSNFGNYLGGVAGPGLSFLALLAVITTLRVQEAQLDAVRIEQLAAQHIRWMDALYADIKETMNRNIPTNTQGQVSVRDVLDHHFNVENTDKGAFKRSLADLMILLRQYRQAVALYRKNVNPFFDVQIFADRGGRVLDALKPFHSLLGNTSPIGLEFCDMHLRGVEERKTPEAMKRSSR